MRKRGSGGRMVASVLKFFLVILAAAVTGCNTDCTEIGCYDGFSFEFNVPLEVQGSLSVAMTGDVKRQCSQLSSSDVGACYDAGITFERTASGRISAVRVQGVHPEQVQLEVSYGGSLQLEASGSPTYERMQPNGPGCPPTCLSGKLVVD